MSLAAQKIVEAREARSRGDDATAHALVVEAESLLTPDDLDGMVEVWSALRNEWMGSFEPDERFNRAAKLLEQLGEAGNVRAQEMLMIDYLEGLGGFAQSVRKFLYWSERAMKNGSIAAAEERRKFGVTKSREGEL